MRSHDAARQALCRIVVAAATGILLAGCTVAPAPPETTNEPETTAAIAPRSWKPDEMITHRTYTEEELAEYRTAYLEKLAGDLEAPPPDVEFVRWTTTPADDAATEAECLTEAGIPSHVGADGRRTLDQPVPAAQEEALYLAIYVCAAKYTPVPALRTDWTPAQIGMAWDYWNEAYIPCLESHGVTMPDEETPTRQVYVDTFYSVDTRWFPPSWLVFHTEESAAIAEACPELPPDQYFYGT